MVRVAIYGASGYTGLELLRLLARHPQARVTTLTTRRDPQPHVAEVHPSLRGAYDLRLENLTTAEVAQRADLVFTCLPHGASSEVVRELLGHGLKVVDLSADYRLNSLAAYERWYGPHHADPERLETTPYGLPELYREKIVGQQLVANPGCYPTSASLALAPLLRAGLIEPAGIIVDSKSGVSGAGRDPKPNLHFPEANENFSAYGVGNHRHTAEIDQLLGDAAGTDVEVVFTPHLVPMERGILSTCYAAPTAGVTAAGLMDALRAFYANEPFVQVVDSPPATRHVTHTNRCHVFATVTRGRVLTVSVIDNLVKGASGAAVQNMNLVCGFAEATALD